MSVKESRLGENSGVSSKFMSIFQMCRHITWGDNKK